MHGETLELLYTGKAKSVYRVGDSERYIQRFMDSATAFNGVKKADIAGKGELNNRISSTIFRFLADNDVASHYVATHNARDMEMRRVSIVPLEVVCRNVVAGSLSKRTGLDEGTPIDPSIVEFYFKNDALGDPLVTEDHILLLGIATRDELAELRQRALRINELVTRFWAACGLTLVDFKLEFGRVDGALLLADEISPDTSRLWDAESQARMDKDVFRRDLADLRETYEAVHRRVLAAWPQYEPGELPPAPAER